jgi:hypothetical protein
MDERIGHAGTKHRKTASLLAHALAARLTARVRRPSRPQLRPTIFVAVRRGEDPDWKSVVARSV